MKRFLYALSVFFVIFMLVSCSREVPKEETEAFFTDVSDFGEKTADQRATRALADFMDKNPDISKADIASILLDLKNIGKVVPELIPAGKGGDYGTYEWVSDSGWVCRDSTYPDDGYIFKWQFHDTVDNTDHQAEVLIDNIQYADDDNDLLSNLEMTLTLDDEEVISFDYSVQFNDKDLPYEGEMKLEIVNVAEFGFEFSDIEYVYDGFVENVSSAMLHFWAIDMTEDNYRIDLTWEVEDTLHGTVTFEDSRGWEIVADYSISQGDTITVTITGEITKDGRHAADIEGTLCSSGENDENVVWVVYPDGTRVPIQDYLPEELKENL